MRSLSTQNRVIFFNRRFLRAISLYAHGCVTAEHNRCCLSVFFFFFFKYITRTGTRIYIYVYRCIHTDGVRIFRPVCVCGGGGGGVKVKVSRATYYYKVKKKKNGSLDVSRAEWHTAVVCSFYLFIFFLLYFKCAKVYGVHNTQTYARRASVYILYIHVDV